MTSTVKAKTNLYNDSDGLLEVPVGSEGTVQGFTVHPNPEKWQVQFTTGQTTVTKWVTTNDIIFVDGPIGPVKAVLMLNPEVVTEIKYPKLISDSDVIIGQKLSSLRSVVQFVYLAYTLQMTADINTGEIKFEFV